MLRKTFITASILFLLSAGMAFGGIPSNWNVHPNPWMDLTGGPDDYGYTWADSDEPGVPVEWIDITATGTLITGLGDDNFVGPFTIGFDFNYYWYTVDQVYCGSNGYLKFPPGALIASPFPGSIPLSAEPNDFLAVYITDWNFSAGGQAYYWTNNVDQFVLSFINVPAWNTGGSHDFQVVLNGSDNTIHYNYGAQSGTVYNNDIIIGIENVSGLVGLEHSHDTYPDRNYSVIFYRPDTTAYEAHDMACTAVMNEDSYGTFVVSGTNYTPSVWVKNVGNQFETSVNVLCDIMDQWGTMVYSELITITDLNPGDEIEVVFPDWTTGTTGQYIMFGWANLVGDMNPNNDNMQGEMHIITLPGVLLYDDGTSAQSWSWMGGTGGMGQRFEMPVDYARITQLVYYIHTGGTTLPTFTAQVLDDDGPGGSPGTVMFETAVTATTSQQWYTADCSVVLETGGAVYVAWIMTGENCPSIGMDNTEPFSRCGWEYTGVWAPFRERETLEPMIRIMITEDLTPDVQVTLTPYNTPIQIPAGGGSFDFNVELTNAGNNPATFDAWTMATLPSGAVVGPLLGPFTLTLNPGGTIERDRTQAVPGAAPSGVYSYDAYVGDYPTVVWDEDHFDFEKLTDGEGAWVVDWSNWGEAFAGEEDAGMTIGAPADFALLGAYPNPFNASATVAFSLPLEARVKIEVYNVLGQRIATLHNGILSAGFHSELWNGTSDWGVSISSGLYLVVMEAEGTVEGVRFRGSEKVLLVK